MRIASPLPLSPLLSLLSVPTVEDGFLLGDLATHEVNTSECFEEATGIKGVELWGKNETGEGGGEDHVGGTYDPFAGIKGLL